MDVMGQNGSRHSCLCVLKRKEKTKAVRKRMGDASQEVGRSKMTRRTLKLGLANTARQRFPDRGKQKFVADEKFIAEAKILAKRQRSEHSAWSRCFRKTRVSACKNAESKAVL